MRMDRRAGLLFTEKLPSLAELLADTSLLLFQGWGDSSIMSMTVDTSGIDSSIPYYVFSGRYGMGIVKVKNGVVTRLNAVGTVPDPTVDGNSLKFSSNSARCQAAALVRFPHYTESQIDKTLSKPTATLKNRYQGSTKSTVLFPTSETISDAVYFASYGYSRNPDDAGISFSLGASIDEPIFAVNNSGIITQHSFLIEATNGNTYISENNSSSLSVYGGCIAELS